MSLRYTEKAYFSPFGGGTETKTKPCGIQISRVNSSPGSMCAKVRKGELTILLPFSRWKHPAEPVCHPLVPLPILLIHPLQHLIRYPRYQQLLPIRPLHYDLVVQSHAFLLGIDLHDAEIACYVVPVRCGRVYGDMPPAI